MGKDLKGKELGTGILQRKDGSYCARYVDRFGNRRSIYNKDLRKLKDALNQKVYEDKNKLNIVEDKTTLDEWYDIWMSIHKYKVIRINTKCTYDRTYKKHISPILGKEKLSEITQLQIKSLINNMDKNGYKYEIKNKVKMMLLDMFNKAMIDNYVLRNPCKGIKIEKDDEDEKAIKVLSQSDQLDFFDCCKGTFFDNLFVVAVNTGLRPGELCGLKWCDVDLENNEISVQRTLLYQKLDGDEKKTFHFDPPKTKTSKRKIPINKACEIALKKQYLQSNIVKSKLCAKPVKGFEDLLFTTRYATPINAQIYCEAIKKIVNEINFVRDDSEQMKEFSGHCFRHTFATRCFEAGIQPKTVQKYLGHASLQMTMDLYTHVLKEYGDEEMSKLENELQNIENSHSENIEAKFKSAVNREPNSEKIVKFGVV